jgi:hypothetical protein
LDKKLVSTLNLGGGVFGLLFGLTLVSGAIDLAPGRGLSRLAMVLLIVLLAEVVGGPMLLQLAGQKYARGGGVAGELTRLPAVLGFQIGVSLINLGAGLEALLGRRSGFVRTPKEGAPGAS